MKDGKLKLLCFLSLILASSTRAESIIGYDVLGVAMYCQRFLAAPPLPAMSTLMNTFGDPLPCIQKRAQMGALQIVQVDLIDATCWRNNACPSGVPKPDNLAVIKDRAGRVRKLAEKFPQIEFWVSPALEHDVKDVSRVKKMLDAAKAGCPQCKVINSPFTGAKPDGYKIEKHGTTNSAFSISADGASSYDADNIASDGNGFQHRTAGDYTTFLWWNELNLRCTGEKAFTPPLKRTEKPTADQFRQAASIARPEPPTPGTAPASCQSIRRVTKPEIYKPNAESYCNGQQKDERGNKPLLIIKRKGVKGEKLKVMRTDGKEVGCFKYYGTFSGVPGTHRWYMGDCSGQTPARLEDDFQGEWGYVQIGQGECLLLNAVRRMGAYR